MINKVTGAIIISLFLIGASYGQAPKVFMKNNKYGIIQNKNVLVKPKYDNIEHLELNLFTASLNSQCGIISNNGKIAVPFIYDDIKPFSSGLYLAKKNHKWGLINQLNKVILPLQYTGFSYINEFMYEIKSNDKHGLIDQYGDIITNPEYDNIEPFSNTILLITKNNKKGIIDNLGRLVLPAEFDYFETIGNSNFYKIGRNNKIGIMDSNWKLVIPPNYNSIEDSDIGKNLILNGKIGFYTKNKILIEPIFDEIMFYQPEFGLAVVKKGDKRGFVTSQGVVVDAVYENISRFSDRGIAFVEKEGKLMAVNVMGKEITVQETMQNSSPLPTPSR